MKRPAASDDVDARGTPDKKATKGDNDDNQEEKKRNGNSEKYR